MVFRPTTLDPNTDYTTSDISSLLGIPVPTIHGWVARGLVLPYGKKGKANVFTAAEVAKMETLRNNGGATVEAVKMIETSSPVHGAALSIITGEEKTPAPLPPGHRYWNQGKSEGTSEEVEFGPIKLNTVVDNTEDGQSHVPALDPHFSFDSGEAVVLANALKRAEPTWIFGPSGSGKTSGIKQIAAVTNWPLYRVNMHADVSVADFVGSTEVVIDPDTGNAITKVVDGVLPQAMLNGGILLIDEITATPAHILLVLQAVLERAENPEELWANGESHTTFVNTINGGETIHAHPRFRIIVTDNTNGQGDITGSFAGTNVMNEATRSRFTMWLHKEYPSTGAWRAMLRNKTGVDAETAKAIVGVAQDVNKGSAQLASQTVTNNMVINPRDTLAVARLVKSFGDIGVAFKVGVINSMNPGDPDIQFVTDLIKAKLAV